MWFLRVETDFVDTDGEPVVSGPYYFQSWEDRKAWEMRFRRAMNRLNECMMAESGRKIKAWYCGSGQPDTDDIVAAPDPEEAVQQLRALWERGNIVPKAA